jgi:peptidoglycan/xylan/chitin deacetylase (PgdA/CDA1 family)
MSPGRPADVLVLCYHAVGVADSRLCVSPGTLDQQLRAVRKRGYTPELAAGLTRDGSLRRRVVVTFDDGYRSVRDHAIPVLRDLEFKATVFVTTGFIGGSVEVSNAADLEPSLSWDDLRALADEGWEVGSHTVSHARLTVLSRDELRAEVHESKAEIEAELGRPCVSFAYPWGLVDERVEREVRTAGYEVAFTVSRRMTSPTALRWPRVTVFGSDGRVAFAIKTSPATRRVRETRVGAAAAGLVTWARTWRS